MGYFTMKSIFNILFNEIKIIIQYLFKYYNLPFSPNNALIILSKLTLNLSSYLFNLNSFFILSASSSLNNLTYYLTDIIYFSASLNFFSLILILRIPIAPNYGLLKLSTSV
jgi:hypothetical protein